MERGHMILISGSIILIAGIGISVTSVIDPFLHESTKLINTTFKAGQSISISRHVLVNAEGIPQPGLALSIASKQQKQSNENILLREQIKDPRGRIVSNGDFKNQFFTTTQPESSGNYIIKISNLGNEPVILDAIFGQIPFVNEKNQIQLGIAVVILIGGIAIVVGFLVLIAGGVVLIMDIRKRTKGTT